MWKSSQTDGMASQAFARMRSDSQQDAPPSPANGKLFHPHAEPGTSVCRDTKKPSFILAAKLSYLKKRLPRITDFSEENTKGWTGGFSSKSITNNLLSRPRLPGQAWRGRDKLAPKRKIFWNANVLFEMFEYFVSIDKKISWKKVKWWWRWCDYLLSLTIMAAVIYWALITCQELCFTCSLIWSSQQLYEG